MLELQNRSLNRAEGDLVSQYQYPLQSTLAQIRTLMLQQLSKQQMESESFSLQAPTKTKYVKTSMKKKQLCIDMVLKKNFSIYRASKKLKISNSTAKSIINNYLKVGTILQRNTRYKIQHLNTEPKDALKEQKEQTRAKQEEEEEEPFMRFTDEEREKIIRNMGIMPQTYPISLGPFPAGFQSYPM